MNSAHGFDGTPRRSFLKAGAAGLCAGFLPAAVRAAPAAPADRPNLLLIVSDQLNLDALSSHGCRWARTPNLDRLVRDGMTFMESHSTNPVCSPARSSLFTGRMPVETGVVDNNRPIHPSVPNLGQRLREAGYETVYCGKWHVPEGFPPPDMPGFHVLTTAGQGCANDTAVSRACEAWMRQRGRGAPFFLTASYLEPHDICYFTIHSDRLVPDGCPFDAIRDELPELPPNHKVWPTEPELLRPKHTPMTDAQWRYYLYLYYRQVEMLDRDVGLLLDALDDLGLAKDTVVLFTSDHGEGAGRHGHVQKWYPYDEAMKVPLAVCRPGSIPAGVCDREHLVTGLDVAETILDYAGAKPAGGMGRSLRPLLEQRGGPWRDFLVSEFQHTGRIVRTAQYKYVQVAGDPVEQLFDLRADPWEMKNLNDAPARASTMADHRKLLAEWNAKMAAVEPTTPIGGGAAGRGQRAAGARPIAPRK